MKLTIPVLLTASSISLLISSLFIHYTQGNTRLIGVFFSSVVYVLNYITIKLFFRFEEIKKQSFIVVSTNSSSITVANPSQIDEKRSIVCDSSQVSVGDIVDGDGNILLSSEEVKIATSIVEQQTLS
jgi:uncharacterized membrane protein